jgi:ribonuclease HI
MYDELNPRFPHGLSQQWETTGGPRKTLDEETCIPHLLLRPMSDLVAHVDGSCLGSPGQAGIGVIIRGWKQEPIRVAKWIGHQDNNVAEYVALLEALQYAVRLSAAGLHVYSDSEVVVKQMKGAYLCRSSRLYSLNWVCRKLARSLAFSISHIPREINREANALAHSAVRQRLLAIDHKG